MEILARSAQVLIALGGAYVVAFWFVLIVWTFRDIEARSRSVVTQVVSTLMVVLFFVPGVLLYLILRPKETRDEAFQRSLEEEYLLQDLEELPLCQACHRYVEDDFVLCPHCHAQLREPCLACSRLVDLRWPLCPYCATVQHGRTEEQERVETPAARWTAPNLRRRRAVPEGSATGQPAAVAANGAAPKRVTTDPTDALPAVEEPAVVAASAAEPRPTPFTLVSGMRSVVRPLDRMLGRDGNGSEPDLAPTNGNGANATNGNGASRRFGPFAANGDASAQESALPGRTGGIGNHATLSNGRSTAEGVNGSDSDRRDLLIEEARRLDGQGDTEGKTAVDEGLVEIPGRRR